VYGCADAMKKKRERERERKEIKENSVEGKKKSREQVAHIILACPY
jgi:hypothetical protein